MCIYVKVSERLGLLLQTGVNYDFLLEIKWGKGEVSARVASALNSPLSKPFHSFLKNKITIKLALGYW